MVRKLFSPKLAVNVLQIKVVITRVIIKKNLFLRYIQYTQCAYSFRKFYFIATISPGIDRILLVTTESFRLKCKSYVHPHTTCQYTVARMIIFL